MSDLKKWYLGGMVVAADKAEFKEDEHPRGKGGMFVKKGEGGGSSALEEVYKKGGFKHPEALAKADFEELGKMDDSRLDAEITMLKGKVEEGGKPLDKARLEVAEGIMKGRSGKKVEGGGSDGVAGKVAAYREKHEAFSKELLKDLNSPVAEKMRGELQSMLSELDGMGVDVELLAVGKDDKIPMRADKAKRERLFKDHSRSRVYTTGEENEVNRLLKMDNEEFDDIYDYTKSWIDEARSGSVKLAMVEKWKCLIGCLRDKKNFLGFLRLRRRRRRSWAKMLLLKTLRMR